MNLRNRLIKFLDTANNLSQNLKNTQDISYIVEPANWSIRHDGVSITGNLSKFRGSVTTTAAGIRNRVIHFGSEHGLHQRHGLVLPHPSNRLVMTWFHVVPNAIPRENVSKMIQHVDLWHTSCLKTKQSLLDLGIPADKLVVIPLGVDLSAFTPSSPEQVEAARKKLGIPPGYVAVGSFQKDGNGWGEGLEPKLVKGPDIFCDAIEKLARRHKVFVVLSGPARGYVKRRLKNAGIPYVHHFLDEANDVAKLYQAIDLYLITSRIEGGPKSLLESMACGIPLVSTKVGMAEEVIRDGENGALVEIEHTDQIVARSLEIIKDQDLRSRLIANGRKTVQAFGWNAIARQYEEKIYSRLKKEAR